MKRQQAGFTIIELVMVIVILGILSAFALPRFADLGSDARVASLNGLAGALKSAAAIAHAEQLVTGGAPATSVTLEGQTVTMINGYPTADTAGIGAAAAVDASYGTPTVVAGPPGTITWALQANCSVTYTAAAASPGTYAVGTTITGC